VVEETMKDTSVVLAYCILMGYYTGKKDNNPTKVVTVPDLNPPSTGGGKKELVRQLAIYLH